MPRILLADKDESLRTIVTTRLSARQYEVVEALESEDVLRLLSRESFDLILIADDMDRISGKRLIEKIREQPHLTNLPIILMTREKNVAELVMSQDRGFDDFLIKPFNSLVLQLRVSINIARIKQRVEANALTHLPGNHSIERIIRKKIKEDEKFSVLYIDINQFKAFNDCYGFEKGDDVIRQTAKILLQIRLSLGTEVSCFVGHIGGDDFIVVTHPDDEEKFARAFMAEFDRIMATYYSAEDRKKGYVRTQDRRGKKQNIPLMSCSIAACNNLYREYHNLGEIAQDAAQVKSFLKSQPGSHYLRDRRSAPMHDLKSAMEVLEPEIKNEVSKRKKTPKYVDPLGQTLVQAGIISKEQLDQALKKHLETGQRLGQVLINMRAVTSLQVGQMLERRLNIPYTHLESIEIERSAMRLFTTEFMKSHRVLPLNVLEDRIQLGMCDPFDLRTLDAIEGITGLKPVPSLVLEDEFEDFIEKHKDDYFREEKVG